MNSQFKLTLLDKKNIKSLVSDAGDRLPPSGIREFFDIVYSTPDCISLGVGEPDFVTPWRISDTGAFAIKNGYTHYTPNRGLPELRELLSDSIKEKTNVEYNPDEELIITMGVSQGLDLALRSVVNPGDEVIIFEPCYVSYSANVDLAYGKPVVVPTDFNDDFRVDVNKLRKSITSRTKAIILSYPSNPTGMTIDEPTLKNIAAIAYENNLIIISDEIYSDLTYNEKHTSIISMPGMKERTIYLNGFSKAYAMTGWRLGYIAGPQTIVDIMLKIHQYTALCASSISQYAAIEAIKNSRKDVERMKSEYLKRRNFMYNQFIEMDLPCHIPEGAFYLFPNISVTGMSSKEFAIELLKAEKVAVVPGDVFGSSGKDHIRCSYATSLKNIKEAMKRMRRFLEKVC
ncbi:MAG: aminotransferase class I/II-fold pyridoxal phosphate-dependent enzyme [Spirochaetota bacterium]|nr:aminotransferase class I/II-fold pyridoxal phosphate-dependent enzyme [Spirochaetota bacterium]